MTHLFLVCGVVVFLVMIRWLDIVARVQQGSHRTHAALGVMRDAAMPEREKERAMQRAAGSMSLAFLDILVRSTAAFAVPTAGIYAGALAGLYTTREVVDAAWNPYFLLFATVIAGIGWRFAR